MTKFKLVAQVPVRVCTTVEAETLQEAIRMASCRPIELEETRYYSQDRHWLVEDIDGGLNAIRPDED